MKQFLIIVSLLFFCGETTNPDLHCSFIDDFFVENFSNELEADFEIKNEHLIVNTIYNCKYYKIYIPNIQSIEIYENPATKLKYIGIVAKSRNDIIRRCKKSLGDSRDHKTLIGGPIINNLQDVDKIPNYFEKLFNELGL